MRNCGPARTGGAVGAAAVEVAEVASGAVARGGTVRRVAPAGDIGGALVAAAAAGLVVTLGVLRELLLLFMRSTARSPGDSGVAIPPSVVAEGLHGIGDSATPADVVVTKAAPVTVLCSSLSLPSVIPSSPPKTVLPRLLNRVSMDINRMLRRCCRLLLWSSAVVSLLLLLLAV